MTASGKVQKFKLRELIRETLAREAESPPSEDDADGPQDPSGVPT